MVLEWGLLFHKVGYVGQQGQVTGTLNGLSYATLEFQRSAGDATGQDLALLVEEFLEEFGILVVDVLDACTFEAAVFFLLNVYRHGCQVADFGLCLCHCLVLLGCFGGCCFGVLFATEAATLGSVLGGVFVLTEGEEANDAFVTTESCFELLYDVGGGVKLNQGVVTRGLLGDRISQLAQAPFFGVHKVGTGVGEYLAELCYRFLHLFIRQNGS